MNILVNGQPRRSQAGDLLALWHEHTTGLGLPGPQGFAIALNGTVVRQADWPRTALAPQDRVEIVRAFSGG
jgi:sulfur carrier protein